MEHKLDMQQRRARVIAFFLPQYHPIIENDMWWGKGFTEWTNVTRAKPLFRGHQQPILPGELGFYDLRLKEVRAQQAKLAQSAGIEGFCYWHYWFGDGRRVLEKITDEVISSGEPDFPFCLGWANESWTGRWHGLDKEIIIEQTYPERSDIERHFYALLPAFQDRRYIEADRRKLFLLYRPELIPNLQEFIGLWNRLAISNGFNGFYFVSANDANTLNNHSGIEGFVPRHIQGIIQREQRFTIRNGLYTLFKNIGLGTGPDSFSGRISGRYPLRTQYSKFLEAWKLKAYDSTTIPCIIPNWDNTARSGRHGYVLQGSNPDLFADLIGWAIQYVSTRPFDKRLIFLKSWNEWAEGNYVEPDAIFASGYLNALKSRIFDDTN